MLKKIKDIKRGKYWIPVYKDEGKARGTFYGDLPFTEKLKRITKVGGVTQWKLSLM